MVFKRVTLPQSSTAIKAISFDTDKNIMITTYIDGQKYYYFGVTEEEMLDVVEAASIGSAHYYEIREHKIYLKL
jgi:predicted patatin/cPLA2 family phospholipase